MEKATYSFQDMVNLPAYAISLDETAAGLGYAAVVKPMKGEDVWKAEFVKKKPRHTLFTIRARRENWSVNLKLYHVGGYLNLVDAAPEGVRKAILGGGGCSGHPDPVTGMPNYGSCKGPVRFTHGDKAYQLCRHGLTVKNPSEEEINGLLPLFQAEIAAVEAEQ